MHENIHVVLVAKSFIMEPDGAGLIHTGYVKIAERF